jgi:hypothetical protein
MSEVPADIFHRLRAEQDKLRLEMEEEMYHMKFSGKKEHAKGKKRMPTSIPHKRISLGTNSASFSHVGASSTSEIGPSKKYHLGPQTNGPGVHRSLQVHGDARREFRASSFHPTSSDMSGMYADPIFFQSASHGMGNRSKVRSSSEGPIRAWEAGAFHDHKGRLLEERGTMFDPSHMIPRKYSSQMHSSGLEANQQDIASEQSVEVRDTHMHPKHACECWILAVRIL